ncbi:hypothetical protein SAMN04488063_3036 [Halopelagius inordinatus]|uniref:DUF7999 domain-containing protein n=1 Tax=Halopelagius inordinatus TaxID=553467 RepID=A0A1I2UWC0_9EURY|nr:hypothetical protein [Halopelagius inordinatus]SFG81435.1 hypothetical protein SAMN04488063_3036 [Halopelagius inordinatus]
MRTSSGSRPRSVVVRRPMNDHGTMTVEVADTRETRHLVDYESERVRRTLSQLPSGTTVPLTMARAGGRSNVWRVLDFHRDSPATRADADRARTVD